MVSANTTCDVVISHSPKDTPLAVELANACRAEGLEAFTSKELLSGAVSDQSEVLWDALAESRALLAIVSPSGLTPMMGIEIGAAQAWNKPIFAVVTDPSFTRLPEALTRISLYPPERIDDVIAAIKLNGQQLSDQDRELLAELLRGIGVSVDQLALEPQYLQKLVKRFKARTGKSVSGERLLAELLRMRKQGLLRKGKLTN